MPIEMPKGLPFSVDTWTPASLRKRHHFLTHAHKDHLAGIVAHSSRPVYATRLTKALVLGYFPQLDDSLFVEIEVGESVVVDDPDGSFSVTAIDANHCPGAVMFLFEGGFGNILHTGDCRLTPDCLQSLPLKYISKKGRESISSLDYLFLDCTFSKFHLKMPNKESSIQQVISCIWKHPNAPIVYFSCGNLGREEILVEVSKTFGSPIFVNKSKYPDLFQVLLLVAPQILSDDASSRFQVIGLSELNDKVSAELAEARANLQPEPLFIRPSVQWYATNPTLNKSRKKVCPTEAQRDELGIWHVCHSMHSSREELDWALHFLRPKWVISTTPPQRAMDLDYVKNNCYKTNIASDDPLWKLFKGSGARSPMRSPPVLKILKNDEMCTSVPEMLDTSQICILRAETSLPKQFDLKLEIPPLRSESFTLFGRARLGLNDPDTVNFGDNAPSTPEDHDSVCPDCDKITDPGSTLPMNKGYDSSIGFSNSLDNPEPSKGGPNFHKLDDRLGTASDLPSTAASSTMSSNLRKLYRSMNVPVPRPLPSLTDLMETCKRAKNITGSTVPS
ncbi:5' exonuclease Apollo-like [Zingiber officinale]|uniref:5' exonuclease Apollo-like n=1 Tax=Zingiber officinale TaxID=94328 RepID=UPI001C4A8A86|nr:5' exonuclease Apollo-like [Zingiber officinale]